MREPIKQRRLRLWKERQKNAGYDVSNVTTLEEAEHFFDEERSKDYEHLNYFELQEIGRSLGMRVVGIRREEIIDGIKQRKIDNTTPEPPTENNQDKVVIEEKVLITDPNIQLTEEQLAAMNNTIPEPPTENNPIETPIDNPNNQVN